MYKISQIAKCKQWQLWCWAIQTGLSKLTMLVKAHWLGLGHSSKVPHRLQDFPVEVPFSKLKWPYPLRHKIPDM